MPANRNALIRYKTIDKCLQNRYRKWTLNDLIDACSDALYEYEGIDKGISRRTVQADIQMMRSDKLGYNAPIIVEQRKYYTYEDPSYSITNIPLSDQDLSMLSEAVAFLNEFKDFQSFNGMQGMLQKLEDQVNAKQGHREPVIDFEKNPNLKGLNFLDEVYKAIIDKKSIYIQYKSFKAKESNTFDFCPYLLKEYRNRWFLIGKRHGEQNIINLALDRIESISYSSNSYIRDVNFSASQYYQDIIGVTQMHNQEAEEIQLFVRNRMRPYIETKPIHPSQQITEENAYGVYITVKLKLNYELESLLLGFGENVVVLAPHRLRRNLLHRLQTAEQQYRYSIDNKQLSNLALQFQHKGIVTINMGYSSKQLQEIEHKILKRYTQKNQDLDLLPILKEKKHLLQTLINNNLFKVLQKVLPHSHISGIHYYATAYTVTEKWSQKKDNQIYIYIYLDKEGIAFDFLKGSHKKHLTTEEIHFLQANGYPAAKEFFQGHVHLHHPLLLRKRNDRSQAMRFIQLTMTLDLDKQGIVWNKNISS